jgi:hypothetical protein
MYFEEENLSNNSLLSTRLKVIKAIISDTKTRYIGTSKPQKECRFNIPNKCCEILNLKFGDDVYISKPKNSNTSMIITKKEPKDLELLSKIKYGDGVKENKNRLRINQKLAKTFGACDIGISAYNHNNEFALRISPKIPSPDINILSAKNIEDFGKYILWKGRTIKFISFYDCKSKILLNEFAFKTIGGAFYIKKHDVVGKHDIKFKCVGKKCKHCKNLEKYPIKYKALYFPVLILDFDSNLFRPGMLKFVNNGIEIVNDILKEYNNYYFKNKKGYWVGKIENNNRNVWKIENGKKSIKIVKMGIKRQLNDSEKGWLLSLRKDFKKIISKKENILLSDIQNLKIKI